MQSANYNCTVVNLLHIVANAHIEIQQTANSMVEDIDTIWGGGG